MAEDYDMPTKSSILLYQTEDGRQRIEVRLEDETVWLSQRLLAELFQKDVRTINEHIKNIYAERELLPESTIRKFRIVQTEGNRQVARTVEFYNLEVIIAMGYRVRSLRGIRDIYALSADYDPLYHISKEFFATVQNKRHLIEANKADEELREAVKKLIGKETIEEGNKNG